jgi:hypothetical protein
MAQPPEEESLNPFSCATTNADGTCKTRNRFSFNGQLDVIPPKYDQRNWKENAVFVSVAQ